MKSTFWILAILVLNSSALVFGVTQDALEQQREQEREKIYQGGETQEEKEYYQKVAPQDIEKNRNYLQHDHSIQANPQTDQPLQEAPIPQNQIPENPLD